VATRGKDSGIFSESLFGSFRTISNFAFLFVVFITTRTMNEIYRHLSIEVNRHVVPEGDVAERPLWTVNDGLQKFFASEKRDVKCEKCQHGTTATQTLAIRSQPKALILHLKRFVVREKSRITTTSHNRRLQESRDDAAQQVQVVPPPVEMIIAKNKDQVVVAESFDLNAFVPKPTETSRKYKLSGMVHHHGSTPSSGHYTADAVRVDGDERQWVSFDDGSAWPADINKLLKSPTIQRNAYMLLYTLGES
jgi:ubiquitin C-terminal hydrolase